MVVIPNQSSVPKAWTEFDEVMLFIFRDGIVALFPPRQFLLFAGMGRAPTRGRCQTAQDRTYLERGPGSVVLLAESIFVTHP